MTPDDKLDKLQHEIDEARTEAGLNPKEEEPPQGLGQAMRLGVELVAGVMVGSVFGYFVDRWLHTMPLFFIICFFLGAAAGFRNMIRSTKNL